MSVRGLPFPLTASAGVAVIAVVTGGAYLWNLRATEDAAHAEWTMLGRYCVDCHNKQDLTADLAFDALAPDNVSEDPELWEEVLRKLRGRMMPPPGGPMPTDDEYAAFVSWVETTLDETASARPNPGHVALHRLNRNEYASAVRDILGVEVDPGALLPKDDESDGFDNNASVLKVSPSFIDQYISAARTVSALAVGDPAAKFESRAYYANVSDQTRHVDGLPLGTRGGLLAEHFFPADGEYEFSIGGLVSAGYTVGMEHRHKVLLMIDRRIVFEREIGGEEDLKAVDQGQATAVAELRATLENIRLPITAGPHEVVATFEARTFAESDDWLQPFVPGGGDGRIMSVRRLDIEGPFQSAGLSDTPSRQKIFTCRPQAPAEESPCAKRILSDVARLAFRRPVDASDLEAALRFYDGARERGGFEAGIRDGLIAILVSPKFLYRAEHVPDDLAPGSVYVISDFELASRLSFFLWSSVPDGALLEIAEQGRLHEPDVLRAQMRRMLADPRAEALVTNFAFQWLRVDDVDGVEPDPVLFPNFTADLREAFKTEMRLFLAGILLDGGSVLDLLDADYTYANERLALHYDLAGVRGDQFRRIALDDPRRWGLFGKGALLMLTSYPNRTSPVLRGAWILENITGTPVPAPPPDVEAFPETQEGEQPRTVRERLEQHRESPSCNGCHGVMDPLGFALENFDAIGEWRSKDREAGEPIDAHGELVDGTHVEGPRALSTALLERPELVVQALTEKLMTYALGRGVEYYDMPAVRAIVDRAAGDGYRFESILMGVVESDAFTMRTVPAAEEGEAPSGAIARNQEPEEGSAVR